MTFQIVAARIRMTARPDASEGRSSDPRSAIRKERLPRLSAYHYRSLCEEYERAYGEEVPS